MISKRNICDLAASSRVVDDSYVQIVDPETDREEETRTDVISRLVKGRRVLHVGCCDHVQLIDKKRADGTWLHDIICRQAEFCIGVDINQQAVDHVHSLGIPNVYCADLTKGIPFDPKEANVDLVVLGDIVEHLDSPVEFLRCLRENLGSAHQLLVTVPNAFCIENFENACCGFERINSDHRFWFTPYTLCKVLVNAGYRVCDVRFVFRVAPEGYKWGSRERAMLVETSPAMRDSLLVVAESVGLQGYDDSIVEEASSAPQIRRPRDIYARLQSFEEK